MGPGPWKWTQINQGQFGGSLGSISGVLDMKAVEEAILNDFSDWFNENGTTQKSYEEQKKGRFQQAFASKI